MGCQCVIKGMLPVIFMAVLVSSAPWSAKMWFANRPMWFNISHGLGFSHFNSLNFKGCHFLASESNKSGVKVPELLFVGGNVQWNFWLPTETAYCSSVQGQTECQLTLTQGCLTSREIALFFLSLQGSVSICRYFFLLTSRSKVHINLFVYLARREQYRTGWVEMGKEEGWMTASAIFL